MTYSLLATKRFRKELSSLDDTAKKIVKEALAGLIEDLFTSRPNADIRQLKNMTPKKYRLRVGDYRIFFYAGDDEIKLLKIADRKTAYKR